MLVIPFFIGLQNKDENLDEQQSLCPLKMATGFPCPSCGITKSIIQLYSGNLEQSIHYHLFGPFIFGFCIFTILLFLVEIYTQKSYFNNFFFNTKIAYFLGISLAVYHCIRLYYFISENTISNILKESVWK